MEVEEEIDIINIVEDEDKRGPRNIHQVQEGSDNLYKWEKGPEKTWERLDSDAANQVSELEKKLKKRRLFLIRPKIMNLRNKT
jgi:hypothetical protein